MGTIAFQLTNYDVVLRRVLQAMRKKAADFEFIDFSLDDEFTPCEIGEMSCNFKQDRFDEDTFGALYDRYTVNGPIIRIAYYIKECSAVFGDRAFGWYMDAVVVVDRCQLTALLEVDWAAAGEERRETFRFPQFDRPVQMAAAST